MYEFCGRNFSLRGVGCNDPYQIIRVFNTFDQVWPTLSMWAQVEFSRMNSFGLTKAPFRRPRRYEFIDERNVIIQLTDKKLRL